MELKIDISNMTSSVGDNFRTEWGSGRKCVSSDMFEIAKRSMEEVVKMPILRADEPPVDAYKIPIGRDFRYCFYGLLSKKRSIEKMADTSLAK